jgi:hypothetical protein
MTTTTDSSIGNSDSETSEEVSEEAVAAITTDTESVSEEDSATV